MNPVAGRAAETALVLALVAWRISARPLAELGTDLVLMAALAWGALTWSPSERARTAVSVAACLALFAAYAWRHLPMILDHLRLAL